MLLDVATRRDATKQPKNVSVKLYTHTYTYIYIYIGETPTLRIVSNFFVTFFFYALTSFRSMIPWTDRRVRYAMDGRTDEYR